MVGVREFEDLKEDKEEMDANILSLTARANLEKKILKIIKNYSQT
jgi:hypothetical protein